MKIQDLTRCALSAALMALCAWITVPSAVPFTMQTFGVFLILNLLGGRLGTAGILAYLFLGVLGMPVFSGFRSGPGVLLGPTGGYLLGFLATGCIYWLLTELGLPKAPAMVLGMAGCYCFGSQWYLTLYGGDLRTVLAACVLPFLVPDALKILLALTVSRRLGRYIRS